MDNGLYFIRVEPAGGGRPENGGVFILRNGRLLGGDAFFYYVGSYSSAGGGWSGEFSIKQHTRSGQAVPVFGATDATLSFAGTCSQGAAEAEVSCANRGYRITLRRIADA